MPCGYKMKLFIKVLPNAKKSEIIGYDEKGHLKIKIASPALEGKANKELISFLSKKFKIPKSNFILLKGETSRLKIVDVPDEFAEALKNF